MHDVDLGLFWLRYVFRASSGPWAGLCKVRACARLCIRICIYTLYTGISEYGEAGPPWLVFSLNCSIAD